MRAAPFLGILLGALLASCGPESVAPDQHLPDDAGDAGELDGGASDAGYDAGLADASHPGTDAGHHDAGHDAGPVDGGPRVNLFGGGCVPCMQNADCFDVGGNCELHDPNLKDHCTYNCGSDGDCPDDAYCHLVSTHAGLCYPRNFTCNGAPDAGHAGACNNTSDQAALNAPNEQTALQSCSENNINFSTLMLKEPQALQCIEATGLSTACATCIDTNANCAIQNCLSQCVSPTSTTCSSCRATHCDPAFLACSGLQAP